jgi:TolB-like protein
MKHLNSLFAVLILFSSSTLFSQDQLVQRRVLLVDFANLQSKADFEYLQISIPEAMLTALSDTKNFDLLPADSWSNLVERGDFAAKDNRSDQKTRNAGLSQGADVVVIGSFATIDQDLKITARALEVESGRVIVSKSVLAKTDGSMFGSIDQLSADLAKEMKQKLPPLPPREIIREKKVYKDYAEQEGSKVTMARLSFGKPVLSSSQLSWRIMGDLISFRGPIDSRFFGKFSYGSLSSPINGEVITLALGLVWPIHLTNNWSLFPGFGIQYSFVNGDFPQQSNGSNGYSSGKNFGPVGTISAEYAFDDSPVGVYGELIVSGENTTNIPNEIFFDLTLTLGVTYRGIF